MVSRVFSQGEGDGEGKPNPGGGDVAAQQKNAQERRQKVGGDVLKRMGVDRDHGNRGRPFVVLLVNELVDALVVEQSGRRCE